MEDRDVEKIRANVRKNLDSSDIRTIHFRRPDILTEVNMAHEHREFADQTKIAMSTEWTYFLIYMLAVLVFSVLQGFRFGFGSSDYLFLLIGTISSVTGAAVLMMSVLTHVYNGVRRAGLITFVLAMIPYAFILYLFFYRGLWSLSSLTDGFSFLPIAKTFIFSFIAFKALKHYHRISEIAVEVKRHLKSQF